MCGIAGILAKNGALPDQGLLKGMAVSLAHRGPDGEGVWIAPGIGLAHSRLAVLDLSPRASQPMVDEKGEIAIVFNGEIYNYRELKAELSAEVSHWRSDSDTEIVLQGYRVWGSDLVKRLRGMFAIALWDGRTRQLLLARDRIGKKPLYFAVAENGDLIFASEIKALKGVVPLAPDMHDVRTFLGLQYVPAPRTGLKGVSKLEPGCLAVCHEGQVEVMRYHRFEPPSSPSLSATRSMSDAEIDAGIRERLEQAILIRQLAADVPVGAFLSGGVDSAAVVAYASKHLDRPMQTFTMGFPELYLDERQEAREIAKRFGADHQEFEARPEHLIELLDKLVTHYDAPYADSSALPLWLLAKETAREIKVILTGDGGDEVFGGYRRYVAYDQALTLARLPLISGVAPLICHQAAKVLRDPRYDRMAQTVEALRRDPSSAYGVMFTSSYFTTRVLEEFCAPGFIAATSAADAVAFMTRHMDGRFDLASAMHFDLTSYLPDDLNVKMDRATMAFGLEARAPFLDQELVAWALTLPLRQKVAYGKTKIALKRALRGVVPDAVLDRPKRGFQVPLAGWFRGPLASLVKERVAGEGSPLHAFMRREALEKLVKENAQGANHGNRLWMLLTLATWLEQNKVA